MREFYADLDYDEAGRLVITREHAAIEPEAAAARVVRAVREGLVRSTGGSDVPVLTVGRQTMRGYAPGEWNGYLDAAGYPKQSQLPAGYAFPAATPLTEPVAAARPAATAAAPAAQNGGPAAPPPPAGNAPPGFRF